MTSEIHSKLEKLLDSYLADLKSEADTIVRLAQYLNDSAASRAERAKLLEHLIRKPDLVDMADATEKSGPLPPNNAIRSKTPKPH